MVPTPDRRAVLKSYGSLGRSGISGQDRRWSRRSGARLRVRHRAMACCFEVLLDDDCEFHLAAIDRTTRLIDQLETQLTVFRDDSEISRINRKAFGEAIEVEEQLIELLCLSLELSRTTGGAFDMTSAPLSRCWGFWDGVARQPTSFQIDQAKSQVDWQAVVIDRQRHSLTFKQPCELDLGAIGKGYALDRVAVELQDSSITNGLIHAGHSTVLAWREQRRGRRAQWPVGLRHPLEQERDFGCFRLSQGALSTSGQGERSFRYQGKSYGHVIDPRSGYPAATHLSATVVTDGAARADALSTAFLVMEIDEIKAYCARFADVTAVVTTANPFQVHCWGPRSVLLETFC